MVDPCSMLFPRYLPFRGCCGFSHLTVTKVTVTKLLLAKICIFYILYIYHCLVSCNFIRSKSCPLEIAPLIEVSITFPHFLLSGFKANLYFQNSPCTVSTGILRSFLRDFPDRKSHKLGFVSLVYAASNNTWVASWSS